MTFLSRLAGITEKEWPRTRSMALLCFVLMTAMALGRSARDAFFIKNAGADSLPFVYVLNGFLVVTIAAIYTRTVHRLSLSRFMGALCIFFSGFIVLFRAVIGLKIAVSVIPYAVWSLAEMYNILAIMHFWTFANTVFDPREGKRTFPLIGGAGLIGMIFGGLLTPVFVGLAGSNNLLFVWAAITISAIPFIRFASRAARESGIIIVKGTDQDAENTIAEDWRALWKIPLVRTLAFIAFPMWIAVWLIDFQFFHTLESVYPEQDQLASFLGTFSGLTSLIGLGLQFFVTGRLLQILGVGGAALVYPSAMAIAALGLSVRPLLPAVGHKILDFRNILGIGGKFTDETLFGSVHDSTIALLFSSLPDESRAGGRAFLTGTMEPVATACAGVLLLIFGKLGLPPIILAGITLGFSGVWMFLALRIKNDYLNALVANLNSRNIDLQRNAYSQLSTSKNVETREILLAALASHDEEMALFAIELIGPPDLSVILRLNSVVPQAGPRLKVALLKYLGQTDRAEAAAIVRAEIHSEEPAVRAAAVRSLGLIGNRSDTRMLAAFMKDSEPAVAAEAVILHLKSGAKSAALARLDRFLRAKDTPSQFQAARILKEIPMVSRHKALEKLISRSNEETRNEAVRALGRMKTRQALAALAGYLGSDDVYLTVKEGLLAFGEPALPALHAELVKQTESEAKINVIQCIGEIASLRSIAVLARFIVRQPILVENAAAEALTNIRMKFLVETGSDLSRADSYFSSEIRDRIRHCYFSVVENLQKDWNHVRALRAVKDRHSVALVLDAVDRFSRQRLEIALKFLELIADPRTIRALAADLQFGETRARAEAIEALEGSGGEAEAIVRVLEGDQTAGEAPPPGPDHVLRNILWKNNPPWITATALHAAGSLNLKMLEPELFVYVDHSDPLVALNARAALRRLKSKTYRTTLARDRRKKNLEKETRTMDTRMERFLFLRSVPLFADVDGSDLHWINEITHEQKFRSRQMIFREGDPGESLYIIINGGVRVFKGQKGKEVTIDVLQERDCFGEMAILDQEPRSASVMAVRNTRLLVIHRADFQRLLIARPRISFALFKTMSKRVREANARFLKLQKAV